MDGTDGLVELPVYKPAAPVVTERSTRATLPTRRRSTLLDRLVATSGVDRVEIDVTALEADIDRLRTAD